MASEAGPDAVKAAGRSVALRAGTAVAALALATAAIVFWLGDAAYLWVKAAHVIAVIAWMAGMLYLPRLFIYHCDAPAGSPQSETFKVMEQRLLRIIINPAMILTWVFGLWLAWNGGWLTSGWFHGKLLLVLALTGAHIYFSRAVRKFSSDQNDLPARTWRMLNEVPAVLMIGIVILVIVKPF
jgi:protoporphyrinogen IX oxidase